MKHLAGRSPRKPAPLWLVLPNMTPLLRTFLCYLAMFALALALGACFALAC